MFPGAVGAAVFGYSWWYAMEVYGWFLGLSLGWIPAAILGIAATCVVDVLCRRLARDWPVVLWGSCGFVFLGWLLLR